MCLVTKNPKPYIADRDIKVYKHVEVIDGLRAISPMMDAELYLNEVNIAQPENSKPIKKIIHPWEEKEYREKEDLWEIHDGAIHAYLWPSFPMGKCLEAYIPKGTEYWIDKNEQAVCAKKLYITNKEIKIWDNAPMDINLAEDIYNEHAAKDDHEVPVGSFLVENGYISPYLAAKRGRLELLGMVVGHIGDRILVADMQNVEERISMDTEIPDKQDGNFINTKFLDASYDEKNFKTNTDGYLNTMMMEDKCKSKKRYAAYQYVKTLGKDHYIPSAGEIEFIGNNFLCIAAACSLAGIKIPIGIYMWLWTSTPAYKNHIFILFLRKYFCCTTPTDTITLIPFIKPNVK